MALLAEARNACLADLRYSTLHSHGHYDADEK